MTVSALGYSQLELVFVLKAETVENQFLIGDLWVMKGDDWEYLGKTEQELCCQRVVFQKTYLFDFDFSKGQLMRASLRKAGNNPTDPLCSVEFNIVTCLREPIRVPVKEYDGEFLVECAHLDNNGDLAHIVISINGYHHRGPSKKGKKLCFTIERLLKNQYPIELYKSEVFLVKSNHSYEEFVLPVQVLEASKDESKLSLALYAVKKKGNQKIGDHVLGSHDLKEFVRHSLILQCDMKPPPVFMIEKFKIEKRMTFLQLIHFGLELNLWIAIDFTQSNGDPRNKSSLHYLGSKNVYEECIETVCKILAPYDSDQNFPLYGFGGVINSRANHCFPLDPENPEVHGIEEVFKQYRKAIASIPLFGPTLFSPLLKHVVDGIRDAKDLYSILLILTDGMFNDFQDAIDEIVKATELPLSILIVGVGDGDFQDMVTLDADEVPLTARNGTVMKRDIVQFVPYRNFVGKPIDAFAHELLDELPRQITEWHEMERNKQMEKKGKIFTFD